MISLLKSSKPMILYETLIQEVDMIFKRFMENQVKEGNIITTMEIIMIIWQIPREIHFGIWII
jgi:hypothetical protein